MKKRAIITLAMGSQYYHRMALALMISAQRFGKSDYEYFIFCDQETLPYYQVPEWVKVIKLSQRYYQHNGDNSLRHDSFRIKGMIFSDPAILEHDALFLDADCYIFQDRLSDIFNLISQHSMVVYGDRLPENELWGKINLPDVAAKAGYKMNNMWLNSGFIGRAADATGLAFVEKYGQFMNSYAFKPYIKSKFWQMADEPYLAAAYQLTYLEKHGTLPDKIVSPSSDIFITTYDADLQTENRNSPTVHSRYINGTFQPAIIHFLNGLDNSFYKSVINKVSPFTMKGALMRPYFRGLYLQKKAKYLLKKLTSAGVTEERDLQ